MSSTTVGDEDGRDAIEVLYVDDDEALLSLTSEFLERHDGAFAVDTTDSPRDALAALRETEYDAVVSDYQMPRMNGIELLETIREDLDSEVPFIVFTGRGREEVAMEALNLGADRYLQKGGDPRSQYGVLARAVKQEVDHFRTRKELREREEHLRITLESIGDAVIATDANGTVTRMNEVAERLTGWGRRDAVGRPVGDVFDVRNQATERPVANPVERVLREGRTVGLANGTLLVGRDGEKRYIADSGAPIETEDGDVVGAVLVFRDVTERYRRRRRRQRQQEALLDIANDGDVVGGNFEAALETITERAADVLGVERAAVWLLDDEGDCLRCESLYDRAADEHDAGATLTADEYPAYFDALARNRAIDAADAIADDRTAELADYARDYGIGAMLDATIRDGGGVVGVVCHEHVGDSREWTDDEIRFAAEVSDQVLKALQNHRRRRRERRYRHQKEFLDTAVDSLDDLLYAFDEDGTFLRWNERFEAVTGYGSEEIAARAPTDFFEGDDADRFAAAVERIREERDRVTVRADLVTADGEAIPYEFTGAPMEADGEVIGIVGVGRDRSAARSAERRFRGLLEQSPAPTLLIDDDGRISYCNDAAVDLAGAETGAALRDRPFVDLVVPADRDRIADRLATLLGTDGASNEATTVALRAPDGTERRVVARSASADGIESHGAVVVLRDVTDCRERRRALERRNERLETASRTTAHDLRTPVQVALEALALARETGDDEHLTEAREALERVEELVDDLSTLAEDGAVEYDADPVDLGSVVESLAVEPTGAAVDLSGTATLCADRAALKRLLENLVSNAVEHRSTGERTGVGAGDADDGAGDRVAVEIGPLPDREGFYVEDDGPGIPPGEREAVFRPGYSTKDGGSGFGLVSVERIARAHGWSVAVTESAAGGARFEITGAEAG